MLLRGKVERLAAMIEATEQRRTRLAAKLAELAMLAELAEHGRLMTALSTPRRGIVDPATPSYRWWLLVVTSIGALLASLNSGTLVIALPEILRDLHTDLFSLLWIVVGYTLVVTVLVLNAGRLADRYGRARTYTLGIAVFTLASVFCAIAPTAFAADPGPRRPGRRRRVRLRQLGGPGHRRLPPA